jgi:lysophospholipase L1-like esterase
VETLEAPIRIAVFGDSIAAGLGAAGRPFPLLVAEALGAELVDLSASARQVSDSSTLAEGARGCEIAIVAHGPTEALLRPTGASLRLLPPRWRRAGWLDPRPYFSSRPLRGRAQRLESALRWRLKVRLMRAFGAVQWTGPAAYESALHRLVEGLRPSRVLVVGPLPVDDRFFPGSAREVGRYREIGRAVAGRAGVAFVDVWGTCRRWPDFCADHFHPNQAGHERIAARVLAALDDPAGRPRPRPRPQALTDHGA